MAACRGKLKIHDTLDDPPHLKSSNSYYTMELVRQLEIVTVPQPTVGPICFKSVLFEFIRAAIGSLVQ